MGLCWASTTSLYSSTVMDVTPECDCPPPWRKEPLVPDLGIVASSDPVAVEQAAYDLVKEAEGAEYDADVDKFQAVHDVDPTVQIKHAENMGMGESDYDLIDIS